MQHSKETELTHSAKIELVRLSENLVYTTTVIIAAVFGKAHKDVLRCIINQRNFTPIDFFAKNFIKSWYKDDRGRRQPMYKLTKDGFAFLVMGFTGPEAARFKIEFIEAFNRMEGAIKQAQPAVKHLAATVVQQAKELHELRNSIALLQRQQQQNRGIPVFFSGAQLEAYEARYGKF